jgi:hypothetical protein
MRPAGCSRWTSRPPTRWPAATGCRPRTFRSWPIPTMSATGRSTASRSCAPAGGCRSWPRRFAPAARRPRCPGHLRAGPTTTGPRTSTCSAPSGCPPSPTSTSGCAASPRPGSRTWPAARAGRASPWRRPTRWSRWTVSTWTPTWSPPPAAMPSRPGCPGGSASPSPTPRDPAGPAGMTWSRSSRGCMTCPARWTRCAGRVTCSARQARSSSPTSSSRMSSPRPPRSWSATTTAGAWCPACPPPWATRAPPPPGRSCVRRPCAAMPSRRASPARRPSRSRRRPGGSTG